MLLIIHKNRPFYRQPSTGKQQYSIVIIKGLRRVVFHKEAGTQQTSGTISKLYNWFKYEWQISGGAAVGRKNGNILQISNLRNEKWEPSGLAPFRIVAEAEFCNIGGAF